jgi:hypothetical protein
MSDLGRETWRVSYLKHEKGVAGGAGEFIAKNQLNTKVNQAINQCLSIRNGCSFWLLEEVPALSS